MTSNPTQPEHHRRILIVDDNHAIHDDLRKILSPKANGPALEEAEATLFEQPLEDSVPRDFELVSAFQGEAGLEAVRQAVQHHQPFAMAFVDVRMPPGLDGIDTTLRMWEIDPALQVVVCTAYSDYSFDDMVKHLGVSDRALILKKPFDVVEVLQMACMLTEKWRLSQTAKSRMDELEGMVAECVIRCTQRPIWS